MTSYETRLNQRLVNSQSKVNQGINYANQRYNSNQGINLYNRKGNLYRNAYNNLPQYDTNSYDQSYKMGYAYQPYNSQGRLRFIKVCELF